MAVTSNTYTVGGSGQAGPYSYAFPILADADVKVSVDGQLKTVTTHYTVDSSNTRITFVSGQEPSTGQKVIVYRDTDEDPIKSVFSSGSTLRSTELNDNFNQLLYIAQETEDQAMSTLGGTMQANFTLGKGSNLIFEGATDNTNETTITVVDPTADRTITIPNVTGTVVTTGDTGTVTSTMIADGTIATADLANTAVEEAKIQDSAVTNSKIATNAVTGAKIGAGAVTITKIAADAVDGTKIADDSINSEHYVDGSIDTAHLSADAVDGTKIADNAIDSEHYVDGSIDAVHIATNAITATQIADNAITIAELADDAVDTNALRTFAVTNGKIAADAVDGAKIADNAINSEHYVDGSIDTAHIADSQITTAKLNDNSVTTAKIAADQITTAKIVDNAITSAKINAGAVFTSNIAADAITAAKIADNAVGTEHIADAELTTLAGMQSGTASILAGGTALTADLSELNLLDGKSIVTTISGSSTDAQLPTAQAVDERITSLVTDVGGFRPIANETSFPATNPDPEDNAGTIVSVKALASNLTSNGSGVATIANGAGSGNTVTINGMANSDTIEAGKGILVETTSTLHTYTFHRETLAPADITAAQSAVTDFNQRYQVAGSTPTQQPDGTALAEGDLFFDTAANKMKVYDGSNYGEVTSTGDFKYLFLCPAGGTGAPTLTNTTFDLREGSNSGSAASVTNAAQLIVSINGVIQKANTGTSAPAEGFAMVDANTIIFGAAPGAGASVFIHQAGSAVSIPVPGDNTVTTAKIQNLAVSTGKIADQAVDLTKLPHGDGSSNGKYLRSNNGADPTWETISQYSTPLTTRGDLLYRDASGDQRLAKGTSGQYLKIGANDPEWADVVAATADGVLWENNLTISNNYTIAATKGAHSVGPITNNATVTINGVWVIS